MSQQHFSEPPSILARRKDGDGPKKQTREEYRKQKELEELRKAGNAPAEVDESGKDINPHIPKYMVDVPWYVTYDHAKPTLKHQRYHDEKKGPTIDGMDKWYNRASMIQQNEKKLSLKYREGACENCGAMGHKRSDCLEKPRKRIAKYGAQVIATDDFQQPQLNLSFDGKRDRWNGVDMDLHQEKIRSEFEKLEEARRLIKSKNLEEKAEFQANQTDAEQEAAAAAYASNAKEHDSDDEEADEDKYADEMELPGQKLHLESKQRISVRNLRMREDTAKYLLNLDPNSAYYDPKSRSMRDNPLEEKADCQAKDDFLADPKDEKKFFRCSNGYLISMECAPGTIYEYKGKCVFKNRKDCTEKDDLKADPNDPTKFFRCSNGKFISMQCASGTVYQYKGHCVSTDCSNDPHKRCRHGGKCKCKCMNGIKYRTCNCKRGWTGPTCNIRKSKKYAYGEILVI